MRTEREALFGNTPINTCTNTFFTVNYREFAICNVLKGGSLSWKEFFLYYNLPSTFLQDCQRSSTCPTRLHGRLAQVRHPFERLLSSWRHIFHSGGCRLLESRFVEDPALAAEFEATYENITWPVFVRDLVLRTGGPVPDMQDYDTPGVWIRHHWAPYWLTCGVCSSQALPDYILNLETMEEDIVTLFEKEFMMFGEDYLFPRVKTLGTKNKVGDQNPDNLIETYFGQLSKAEVLGLYQLYHVDFQLFGYSPELYLQQAK